MERTSGLSLKTRMYSLGDARSVRILLGMLTVGGTSCAVKLLALVKGSVVARQFGVSSDLDAFYIAYLLPSFLGDLLAGAIVVALVPLYIRTHEQEGSDAAQIFIGNILLLTVGFSIAATFLVWMLSPSLFPMFGKSFQQDQLRLTASLFVCLLPTLPLSAISAILISVLTAQKRLALATVAPGISISVVTVAIYGFAEQWGVYSLAVGITLGLVAQTLALVITLRFLNLRPRVIWAGFTSAIQSFLRQIMIIAAASFIINFIDVIDQYSAGIIGPGNLSTLNYGNKFVLALLGPASLAVSTAVLPHLSELVCARNFRAAIGIVKKYSTLIVAVTVPLTLLLVLWSPTIVMLLFQRNAFTSSDTLQVAAVQRSFLLQIPPHVLGMLFVSLIWSLRANWVLLVINPICLLLKICLNPVLSSIYGVAGIGLATSITYSMSCLLLLIAGTWVMRREERATRSSAV